MYTYNCHFEITSHRCILIGNGVKVDW